MYCMSLRPAGPLSTWPLNSMRPLSARCSPIMTRASVVFPEPDSPMMVKVFPRAKVRLTSLTAGVEVFFCQGIEGVASGKLTLTPSTVNTVSDAALPAFVERCRALSIRRRV